MSPVTILDGAYVATGDRIQLELLRGLKMLERQYWADGMQAPPEVRAAVAELQELRARAVARAKASLTIEKELNGTCGSAAEGRPVTVLTVNSVAMLLGVSPRNVRARARRGSLPASKRGRTWAFEYPDVVAMLDERNAT